MSRERAEILIRVLFAIRVCLRITAAVSTVYWIRYSFVLHLNGIFDAFTYASYLRPVLYTCLIISFAAICISFALYALSKKIRKESGLSA